MGPRSGGNGCPFRGAELFLSAEPTETFGKRFQTISGHFGEGKTRFLEKANKRERDHPMKPGPVVAVGSRMLNDLVFLRSCPVTLRAEPRCARGAVWPDAATGSGPYRDRVATWRKQPGSQCLSSSPSSRPPPAGPADPARSLRVRGSPAEWGPGPWGATPWHGAARGSGAKGPAGAALPPGACGGHRRDAWRTPPPGGGGGVLSCGPRGVSAPSGVGPRFRRSFGVISVPEYRENGTPVPMAERAGKGAGASPVFSSSSFSGHGGRPPRIHFETFGKRDQTLSVRMVERNPRKRKRARSPAAAPGRPVGSRARRRAS